MVKISLVKCKRYKIISKNRLKLKLLKLLNNWWVKGWSSKSLKIQKKRTQKKRTQKLLII